VSKGKRLQPMSPETFEENKAEILVSINLLFDNPKSRNRFRLIAVVDEASGELLAEVFNTQPHGSVVVHRGQGKVSRRGNYLFVRQARGSDDLIVAAFTGDPNQRFRIVAASNVDRSISGRDLTQWMAEGKTTYAISQPTLDIRPPSQATEAGRWLADHVHDIARSPQAGDTFRGVQKMRDDIMRALTDD
jgi:hypothetical protein